MRKNHISLALVLLIAGVMAFTGVQLQASAATADSTLACGSTGEECYRDTDCTNINNITCYCYKPKPFEPGTCREDLSLKEIIDIETGSN